jgi:hypothetical protein
MNKQALRKNEWTQVRIRPIASRFDGGKGKPALPPEDDDWMITNVGPDGVQIENTRTKHGTCLGYEHIHHYTSDPNRRGGYGFLSLTVQVNIGGDDLWIEPNVRPR